VIGAISLDITPSEVPSVFSVGLDTTSSEVRNSRATAYIRIIYDIIVQNLHRQFAK